MSLLKGRLATLLFVPPLFSLAFGAVSWLRYGIDLPFQDDWESYRRGTTLSLAPADLFTRGADTIYPIGRLFDALAQRFLDGNSIAYQLLSMMGILGLLLFFQWRLLRRVLEDRTSAAIAFLLTIFMLQPDTYWGRQNMAFHQSIPLVCVLAALDLALNTAWRDRWRLSAALGLSLIAGFSYVSGSIAMLTTGVSLVACAFLSGLADLRPVRKVGLALLAGATVTLPAHLWVILVTQGGQTHRADSPWTFPNDPDFWLFQLGTVARSLLLPPKHPILSKVMAAAICIAVIAVALWFGVMLLKGRLQDRRLVRLGIVYLALTTTIVAYLGMVSAGRASLRPEEAKAVPEVFIAGFRRFYFAWVTLLWPWLAAWAIALLAPRDNLRVGKSHVIRVALPIVLVVGVSAAIAGAFSHAGYYAKLNKARVKDQVRCLQQQLQAGAGILCPRLYPGDLAKAYIHAASVGSSFVGDYPIPTIPLDVEDPAPLFRLTTASPESWHMENAPIAQAGDAGITVEAATDPRLLISLGNAESLRRCLRLEVALAARAAQPDTVRLFYRRSGEPEFSEAGSQGLTAANDGRGRAEVYFQADSTAGFEPDLKILPVAQPQRFTIEQVEIRCLLWRLPR